ncbi:MAG: CTP synthase [Anaerolineaceae bacterium]|nr:CTP synthase [Anaerolineaceae bacterium]
MPEKKPATRYIYLTGGVVSSVGKGVTAAAIGRTLKQRGFNVAIQKLDPYINVDPGTMSPFQHGEVYVLDDGAETALDLGHYERFIDIRLNQDCSMTSGQVYAEVIGRERHGDYLGGTIQVVPHITNEIKRRIERVSKSTGAEIVLVEVGGTVGDIESQPFIEAIRQMRGDLGRDHTAGIHVTWLPYIGATRELKTKPTQHSVRELRAMGITPDMIVARADHPVDAALVEKIALFCDVEKQAVIPMETASNVYEIPLLLEKSGVAEYLMKRLGLKARHKPNWSEWQAMLDAMHRKKPVVKVGLVGKYTELEDAYMSVREALRHAAISEGVELDLKFIAAVDLEKDKGWSDLHEVAGIVVPGGFGTRGIEGKLQAIHFARHHNIPCLGLCLRMQLMVVDFARELLGDEKANSTEFDPGTTMPVIDILPEQKDIHDLGGTMRLGLYPCRLVPGTQAAKAYSAKQVEERHRHRFELNNDYRAALEAKGMVFSGISPNNQLVEIAELKSHPFMLGTQFHPEFLSRPTRPHPLFKAFIASAKKSGKSRK